MPVRHAALALCLLAAACGAPEPLPALADQVAEARRLDSNGDHAGAVALFRVVIERAPDSYDGHYGLARALDLNGEYDEARDHFARAIELAPEASVEQAIRMMGIAWTFVGNIDEAAARFEQVFQRRLDAGAFAGASDVANEIGRVHLELGDPDDAEAWYRRGHDTAAREEAREAWQIDLADFRWAHAQARIEARRGNAEAARRHVADVERILDKGTIEDQRVQLPYLRGYVALYLGDLDEAATALAAADADDPFILLLRARTADEQGDATAADGFYRRVLESTSHAVNAAFARPIARERVQ